MAPKPALQTTTKTGKTHSASVRLWWAAAFLLLVAGVATWRWLRPPVARPQQLTGYLESSAALKEEYLRFYRKPIEPELERQFQQATDLVRKGDYSGAIVRLEAAVSKVPLPLVYNNLGVLYAQMNDRSRSINAFQSALARDFGYQPVRMNLKRLKAFTANDADPVTREVEPNDSPILANIMAPDTPVEAEISVARNDVDTYRFTAPPPPRDRIAIEINNRSQDLALSLRVYNDASQLLSWGSARPKAGESINEVISPEPNSTLYFELSGRGAAAGSYTFRLKSGKAFDAYEPDDDILHAARLVPDQRIEANIMDADDSDYYSFVSPRIGKVDIELRNSSATLVPGLTVYESDMRASGFGPDVHAPGADLRHSVPVEAGKTYFIQVWPQAKSSGSYLLAIH